MNNKISKTAIIYDWIDSKGGIERVIPIFIKAFPDADIFTSVFDPIKAPWAVKYNIVTSFINKLPNFIKKSRILSLTLYPYAFESFNLSDYDIVISISSSFSKSVITKAQTKHINYMLTPTRYFWIDKNSYYKNLIFKKIADIILPKLKKWDYIASKRPDEIISISDFVKKRVKKHYKRSSSVIYPPFDKDYWNRIKKLISKVNVKNNGFYLIVSRLEYYKKIELAIKVFNKLPYRLIIVGNGSQKSKLKKMSAKNIEFKENISDIELANLYSRADALIMPQVEEFGMVSLEAQFFNCPVISFKNSGAAETILDGKTGLFFDKQKAESLEAAIVRHKSISYNLKNLIREFAPKNLQKFSKEKFIYNLKRLAQL